jgi:hypothetical protein
MMAEGSRAAALFTIKGVPLDGPMKWACPNGQPRTKSSPIKVPEKLAGCIANVGPRHRTGRPLVHPARRFAPRNSSRTTRRTTASIGSTCFAMNARSASLIKD